MRSFVPMSVLPARLRKPAVAVLFGGALAIAWLVRGGPLAWAAILPLLAGIARAVVIYQAGGTDTDEGALAASRADERQQLVGLRSRALAGTIVTAGSFVGLCAGIAARANWWWPFAAVLALAGFGYLLGLSSYGSGEPEPEDDAVRNGRPA